MIPYWAVILIALGFAGWSLLCVLTGAAITASNRKAAANESGKPPTRLYSAPKDN